jgi:hypothetical protein
MMVADARAWMLATGPFDPFFEALVGEETRVIGAGWREAIVMAT